MTTATIVTIVSAVCIAIGCVGIIVPVLPGSILIGVAALVWAIVLNSPATWICFAVIAVLVASGMTSSWLLTGTRLKRHGVPSRSLLVGGILAVIGFFVVPVIGLVLGFGLGLLLMEYLRLGTAARAWQSTWVALKAQGIGILVEFSAALLAAITFGVGCLVHYL